MDRKLATGVALSASSPILSASASAVGVAKTGTAIGTLHGAAQANATAAWVGLGSMKLGMFVMGALPVVGGLLILDWLSGPDHGAPILDRYEEAWRAYEAQCELEEMKKTVKRDPGHTVKAKNQAASLGQLNSQFQAMEVEHDLYLLKKEMGLLEVYFDCSGCGIKQWIKSKYCGTPARCQTCQQITQVPMLPGS
jgi:hypothetical protein